MTQGCESPTRIGMAPTSNYAVEDGRQLRELEITFLFIHKESLQMLTTKKQHWQNTVKPMTVV